MAFKRQVRQIIILVAVDSDFVPAAKLARREGIDFILDPMWARTNADRVIPPACAGAKDRTGQSGKLGTA